MHFTSPQIWYVSDYNSWRQTDPVYIEKMIIVVGISFNLIIIRVDKGIAVGEPTTDSIPVRSVPACIPPVSMTGVEVVVCRGIHCDTAVKETTWDMV